VQAGEFSSGQLAISCRRHSPAPLVVCTDSGVWARGERGSRQRRQPGTLHRDGIIKKSGSV